MRNTEVNLFKIKKTLAVPRILLLRFIDWKTLLMSFNVAKPNIKLPRQQIHKIIITERQIL